MPTDNKIRKESAKQLAAGYSQSKRMLEYFAIASYILLWLNNFVKTARFYVHAEEAESYHYIMGIVAIFGALITADVVSGLVHWGLDTWGTPNTFLFGSFIRSFREHHVDQMAMTKHDLVETNGDSCLVCLPTLCTYAILGIAPYAYIGSATQHTYVLALTLCVAMTNQCHKWAHEVKPHPLARTLMKYKIILTPQNHRVHHSGEFDQYYCITTGWMNYPLDSMNFWKLLEGLVTSFTGEIPRANDKDLLGEK